MSSVSSKGIPLLSNQRSGAFFDTSFIACVADRLNHRNSQSAQRLRKACSDFTGISVSLSDLIDSYELCDSTFTCLTSHASVICMTEIVLCISTAKRSKLKTEKAMFNTVCFLGDTNVLAC